MATLVLGVDMSKASFAAAVWQEQQAQELAEYANESAGFVQFQEQVTTVAQRQGASTVHLIVEPTGGYELPLVGFAYAQGWQVSLPNPRQVRDWAKGSGKRAKTDRMDAKVLAQFGAEKHPPAQPPLATEVRELDNLLARRQDLGQMLRQEQNRLGELKGRPGVPTSVHQNLQQVIEALMQALREIEQAIAQHLQQHSYLQQAAERLQALPGIGPKTVLPLLVLLARWDTLTGGQGTAKGLTALVGLDPQPHESGRSVRKASTISHMGNAELRRLLYMGALGGVRGDNPLRLFYQRLVGRGKPKKLALVAASRKVLTWAIFSTNTDWNPALLATCC